MGKKTKREMNQVHLPLCWWNNRNHHNCLR